MKKVILGNPPHATATEPLTSGSAVALTALAESLLSGSVTLSAQIPYRAINPGTTLSVETIGGQIYTGVVTHVTQVLDADLSITRVEMICR